MIFCLASNKNLTYVCEEVENHMNKLMNMLHVLIDNLF